MMVQKESLPIEVPPLSLDEVKEKTQNFGSNALFAEGSYGIVYYTTLNGGVPVALKKLDVVLEAESDAEFLSQVSMVSRLKHENLIQVLGFCVDANLCIMIRDTLTILKEPLL
ncbi:unnamed protein product [Thlaspi arvense]|uniref:Protein kinase domain-containing protein n=1 Tax=Thlaspi arvense TaxID=13288 RepID=A0AAU9ST03_THLAR|nr:unnamed protein product [Thlaspi arvense]